MKTYFLVLETRRAMEVEKFKKTHVCPKCQCTYFGIVIHWENVQITSKYICEGCNWSFVESNCTSLASVPDLSCSNQTATSSVQSQ